MKSNRSRGNRHPERSEGFVRKRDATEILCRAQDDKCIASP
jgi:hypothetical protein